jgi:hypothetical protein
MSIARLVQADGVQHDRNAFILWKNVEGES